ncbi:hypothetical protein ACFL5O_03450 [Myxococcota bacterium]
MNGTSPVEHNAVDHVAGFFDQWSIVLRERIVGKPCEDRPTSTLGLTLPLISSHRVSSHRVSSHRVSSHRANAGPFRNPIGLGTGIDADAELQKFASDTLSSPRTVVGRDRSDGGDEIGRSLRFAPCVWFRPVSPEEPEPGANRHLCVQVRRNRERNVFRSPVPPGRALTFFLRFEFDYLYPLDLIR